MNGSYSVLRYWKVWAVHVGFFSCFKTAHKNYVIVFFFFFFFLLNHIMIVCTHLHGYVGDLKVRNAPLDKAL